MDDLVGLVRAGYAAFNARDIEGALAAMTEDVEWANGWEGGYVHGHDGVRSYWTRQWQELDPHVTPMEIDVEGDTVDVLVDQVVSGPDGTEVRAGMVRHRYIVRGGRIARMDIHPAD
jgi:ketosteroid isomerase-like protein